MCEGYLGLEQATFEKYERLVLVFMNDLAKRKTSMLVSLQERFQLYKETDRKTGRVHVPCA